MGGCCREAACSPILRLVESDKVIPGQTYRRLWLEFGALGEAASFTPGEEEEGAGRGDSEGGPGGVEGCRGGVTWDSTGRDSGSLSGDTVGSNGS